MLVEIRRSWMAPWSEPFLLPLLAAHSPGASNLTAETPEPIQELLVDRCRAYAPWLLGVLGIAAVVALLGWPW